jgi:hypothetical protein
VPHSKGGTQAEGLEDTVLRATFGPQKVEVKGGSRKYRDEVR